ncbi:MAG TPA: hypothetical protein VK828_12455 [Terriglobales bacterium]|jgi:hypothetical protein|nr:hypothetical protein [Terriglobales bacterium]
MAANSNMIPKLKLALTDNVVRFSNPKETSLNDRVRDMLHEIFEGYEEFLGCTPD